MGLFDFLKTDKGKNQTIETNMRYGNTAIDSFFGGSTSITEDEALQIPSVSSAVDIITGAIAQLDFYIVQKDDKGETKRITDDNRLFLLNKQPNPNMDAYTYKKAMIKDFLLYGASNSVIERNLNRVEALYLLPTKQIEVKVYIENTYKKYSETIISNASGRKRFDNYDLLTILRDSDDGFTGKGILKQNDDVLKMAMNESSYASNVLKNGALPIGVLKAEKKLSDAAFANLKKSWSSLYEGSDKAGKTVILEEGLDYNPISMKPNDLQLTESKKQTLSDIARVFNIPETMINSNAGKYGSNEQNSISFLQYCISPIVEAIEGALNVSLLLEDEKNQGMEFKIDSSKLLQMTRKERAEAIGAEYNAGLLSFWEARSELDKPETTHEDHFKLSLGTVLYKYKNDEMVIPNTMQSKANLEKEKELKDKGG